MEVRILSSVVPGFSYVMTPKDLEVCVMGRQSNRQSITGWHQPPLPKMKQKHPQSLLRVLKVLQYTCLWLCHCSMVSSGCSELR
jgi:hypothetical protein